MSADIITAMSPVVEALERLGVRYHIGGSVASSAQGVARMTLDIDLVADLKEKHARPLAGALENEYYVDEHMVLDAIRRRGSFNVIHLGTMMKVDVFVLKTRAYDKQAFERMRVDTLEDTDDARTFFFASPEDVILNKLEWYKIGDQVARRQWTDVLGVLKVQKGNLDYKYMRNWAAQIEVLDLLESAIEEAEF